MKGTNQTLLKIDELNLLLKQTLTSEEDARKRTERIEDEILDYLIYAYVMGVDSANKDLGTDMEPDTARMQSVIRERTAGKGYTQRVQEYTASEDYSKLPTLAETEFVRVYNQGILDVGQAKNAKKKRWCTMEDNKVRDTHSYLNGITVPFEAEFVTYDGDKALAPHGFAKAENNVNCRCWLKLSR